MNNFLEQVSSIAGWMWSVPLLILLVLCGVLYSIRLGFFQIRYAGYIIKQTFGKILHKGEGEGTVTPFQAAATALACTVGASNITGVPIAIAFGGPGAVFWMWICALLGMSTKFAEVVLGIKYREINDDGVYVSGPMYYLSKGMKNKKVGKFMAFMMVGTMLLIMPFTISAQSVAAVQNAEVIGIPALATGITMTVLIGIITFGGIKRITIVVDKFVPIMVILFLTCALIVIGVNISEIPGVFGTIFKSAFTGQAALGGFAGAGVAAAVRWGFARGIYSTDVGIGSAAMGHAAATVDHPVRQGFWAVFEVGISGLVICSISGIVVLCTGAWTEVPAEKAASMPSIAFQGVFGVDAGALLISLCILFFVISTMIVQVYYGERECEFFFGTKVAKAAKGLFVLSIMLGATLNLSTIFIFLDLILAVILLPHIIGLICMNGQVVQLKKEFFTLPQYYKRDVGGRRDEDRKEEA